MPPSRGQRTACACSPPALAAGSVRETGGVPVLIEGSRRVPRDAAQVVERPGHAVLPHHGLAGAEPPEGPVAGARDADDLSPVVDRGRGGEPSPRAAEAPARPGIFRRPERGLELQDLRRDAGRIDDSVLGPPHDLALVVDSGGVAVGAARRVEPGHHVVAPQKSAADVAGRRRPEKRRAGERLAERVDLVELGDADDVAVVVLHRPAHGAVGSAERAEIDCLSLAPERRVRAPGRPRGSPRP